jgi:hypothetical protein
LLDDFFSADSTISNLQAALHVLVSGIQQTSSQIEEDDDDQLFANVVSSLDNSFDIAVY